MIRRIFVFWILVLVIGISSVQAGDNSIDITAEGRGIAVYQTSSGRKEIGMLYNGYFASLSLEDTNGLYSCWLTGDMTVWMDEDKALARYPRNENGLLDWHAWHDIRNTMPCGMFVAEVTEEEAPLYTSTSHKTLVAKHKKGTLVQVCGEFGDDYYVDGANICGFIPKAAVKHYADMTMENRYTWMNDMAVDECTVYTGGVPLALGFSATGYCAEGPVMVEDGEKVKVVRYLDGWAQLSNNAFIESRFLQPAGDHTIRYATVKSSEVLNRLNVRWAPDKDSHVVMKLCSGAKVQVPSHTDEWAAVCITGTEKSMFVSGSAMMEYLVFDDAPVADGCVRVMLADDLHSGNRGDEYRQSWSGEILPAGTEMTVIGVEGNYNIDWDSGDRFLCRMDNGRAIVIWNDEGVLQPLEKTGITVRTNASVRLREGAGKETESLRTLEKGTKVDVLIRGEGWTMVQYNEQTGYVMSRYLTFP